MHNLGRSGRKLLQMGERSVDGLLPDSVLRLQATIVVAGRRDDPMDLFYHIVKSSGGGGRGEVSGPGPSVLLARRILSAIRPRESQLLRNAYLSGVASVLLASRSILPIVSARSLMWSFFLSTYAGKLSDATAGDVYTSSDEFRQLGEILFFSQTTDNQRFLYSSLLDISRQASGYQFQGVQSI
ncbi:unnamed protein product [Echinostoma caproni]|uniref:RICTOR_N domain-containing protein n=1 Tax=Echinostoma caproni TaxID=27848 RepID=A0A183AP78_9TREM|nr:unnamed protein product [Echinostoma caproni]